MADYQVSPEQSTRHAELETQFLVALMRRDAAIFAERVKRLDDAVALEPVHRPHTTDREAA